jgi:hypothetical protein
MAAYIPGVNNSPNKEKRLFQVRATRRRSKKSYGDCGWK